MLSVIKTSNHSSIYFGNSSLKDAYSKIFSKNVSDGIILKDDEKVFVYYELSSYVKTVILRLNTTAEVIITLTEQNKKTNAKSNLRMSLNLSGNDADGYLIEADNLNKNEEDTADKIMIEITSKNGTSAAYNLEIKGCFEADYNLDALTTTIATKLTRSKTIKTTTVDVLTSKTTVMPAPFFNPIETVTVPTTLTVSTTTESEPSTSSVISTPETTFIPTTVTIPTITESEPSTSSVISTSETTVIPTTVTVPTPNQQICFESEILENQSIVSDIITSPFVFPNELPFSKKGINFPDNEEEFQKVSIEIIFVKENPVLLSQIRFNNDSNVDTFDLILNNQTTIEITSGKIVDVKRFLGIYPEFQNLQFLKIVITSTTDGYSPKNVKLSILSCNKTAPSTSSVISTSETSIIPTTVTVPTTTTIKPTTLTVLPLTTSTLSVCQKGYVYTDILLDKDTNVTINDMNDDYVSLETINTEKKGSLGWDRNQTGNFLDIKFTYSIQVKQIEIVDGSNVKSEIIEYVTDNEIKTKSPVRKFLFF